MSVAGDARLRHLLGNIKASCNGYPSADAGHSSKLHETGTATDGLSLSLPAVITALLLFVFIIVFPPRFYEGYRHSFHISVL